MLDRLISISGREYDREIIKYGLIAMGNGVLSVLIILMCGVIEKRVFESFIYLFCNSLLSSIERRGGVSDIVILKSTFSSSNFLKFNNSGIYVSEIASKSHSSSK